MNKRGLAGKALTILAASGIIALFFFIFIFVLNVGSPEKAFDLKENLAGLSTEGQLRMIISQAADDLTQGNPGSVPEIVKETFGKDAKYALYINDNLVSGAEVSSKSSISTVLPSYAGNPVLVKLEVGS